MGVGGEERVPNGGIVLEQVKAIPEPGQSVAIDGLQVKVEKASAREILTLRLTLSAPVTSQLSSASSDS